MGATLVGGMDVGMSPDTGARSTTTSTSATTKGEKLSTPTPAVEKPTKRRGTAYEQEREDNIARNKRMIKRIATPGVLERLNELMSETGKDMLECYIMMEEEEAAKIPVKPKPKPVMVCPKPSA